MHPSPPPTLPLEGVRVVDLTRILAGPFATMILGDLGADVVKVERPGGGDDTRHWGPPFVDDIATYFLAVNRSKRSIAVDLKRARGAAVIARLLDRADVVVSNFRPGVMEDLGFGTAVLRERHPRLVVCTITGHHPNDPRAMEPSFDLVIQAETGLMDLTGEPEGDPTKVGISIADEVAGLYLVQGVLAALLQRERSGVGQHINIPLNEAMLSMFTYQAQQYLVGAGAPRRMGSEHPSLVPYRPYMAADAPMVVGVANDRQWGNFCHAIGCAGLESDRRYARSADRVANREELDRRIGSALAARPRAEWLEILQTARVPCGPVATVAEALDRERELDTGFVVRTPGGLPMLGSPIRFGTARAPVRRGAPGLGEHTDEILAECGHDADVIAALRTDGVVG